MTAVPRKPTESQRITPIQKKIRQRSQNPEAATKIEKSYKVKPVVARVLAARGFEDGAKLKHYLNPTLKEGLPSPDQLHNLEEACELVRDFAKKKAKVAICCDFDVDGLSGGSQLLHFLRTSGVEASVFVPDRFEDGYGLNEKMIRQIAEQEFGLVITVDYGTTNLKELELARMLGLKTIVIDHHHVAGAPPCCDVFINPQQKGCGFADKVLSASGLAWYFLVGLKSKFKNVINSANAIDTRAYLDLACLGTICDMVPLIGANRVIAKRGLELLTETTRPGLKALKHVVGIKKQVSCYDISFGIGPRINAAGRLVHGEIVVDLLTTSVQSSADQVAHKLNRLNIERQDIEAKVKELALAQISEKYEKSGLPWGIVLWNDLYHTGVIGIVAQRMVEAFYRPTVILGKEDDDTFKGSVRGIKDFSVIEALSACSKHLIKFGGHEGAGGLSVEKKKVQDFADTFDEECQKRLKKIEQSPFADTDTEVKLEEIDVGLVDELKSLSPFGMGNPTPCLLLKNMKVVDVRDIKSAHMKVMFSDGRRYLAGLLWRQTEHPLLKKGATVSVAFKPDYSNYGGMTELQANIQAVELG